MGVTSGAAPLHGYNHNFDYKGRRYHVQTEDSGEGRATISTHVYADGGRIIHSIKSAYAATLEAAEVNDPAQRVERVRALMQAQHKAALMALRDGHLDHLIGSP